MSRSTPREHQQSDRRSESDTLPARKMTLPASTWFRLVMPPTATLIFVPATEWIPALAWTEEIAIFDDANGDTAESNPRNLTTPIGTDHATIS